MEKIPIEINKDPRISLGYPHRPDDMPEQGQIWKDCDHDFEWKNLDYIADNTVCEADLKCKKCGMRGYYSFGHFVYEDEPGF